jgi:hypothetical protein
MENPPSDSPNDQNPDDQNPDDQNPDDQNPGDDGPGDDSSDPPPTFSLDSATPEAFATDASEDVEVFLTFSEALDPDSVTDDTVRLISALSGRLAVSFGELGDENRTLVLRADRPLGAGETLVIEILSSLLAESGAHFEGETIEFRTGTTGEGATRVQGPAFTAMGRVTHLEFGDLDHDGNLDLVFTVENGTTVDILVGEGDGTFTSALRIDPMQPTLHLDLTDLDMDGDLDVMVGTADRARVYLNGTVEGWDGAPPENLAFAFGPEAAVGAGVRSTAVGNLDFNGTPDIVLSTDTGLEVRLDGLDSPVVQSFGNNRQARTALVLADVDLNGTLDLVYGNRTGGRITIHRGTGNPGQPFEEADHVELNTDPQQLVVANFVGDVAPEIVTLTLDGASRSTAFRLLRSLDDAFVVDSQFGPNGNGEESGSKAILDDGRFAVGDLNGDGLLDVVLAAELLGKLVVFENNGTTQPFADDQLSLVELPGPQVTATADVNGDGILDVLAASGNELHLLLAVVEAPNEGEPEPAPPLPEPEPEPEPGPGPEPEPAPPEDTYVLAVDDVEAFQGATDTSTFVRLTNPAPIEAYTTVLSYDPSAIQPKEVTLEGTVSGTATPEFANFGNDSDAGEFTYSILVDFLPPFENRTIPSGENQVLYRLVFDVAAGAPVGTSALGFVTDIADGQENIVVVNAAAITPETLDGTVQILAPPEPPPSSPNVMSIPNITLAAGEDGVVPLLGSLAQDAAAFTTVVSYDTSILEIVDLDLAGSVTEPLEPELLIPSIKEAEGHFVFTAILDFLPPFLQQVIPPGADQELFSIHVRVKPEIASGTVTSLALTNGVGSPPLNNIYVFEGRSIFPQLISGEVHVGDNAPLPSGLFLRGDPTADGFVDLTDALMITNFLFSSGTGPDCRDAADVDDDGRINLTDALYLLNYLAGVGPAPPPPFPEPGPDPSEDEVTCDTPLSP